MYLPYISQYFLYCKRKRETEENGGVFFFVLFFKVIALLFNLSPRLVMVPDQGTFVYQQLYDLWL